MRQRARKEVTVHPVSLLHRLTTTAHKIGYERSLTIPQRRRPENGSKYVTTVTHQDRHSIGLCLFIVVW